MLKILDPKYIYSSYLPTHLLGHCSFRNFIHISSLFNFLKNYISSFLNHIFLFIILFETINLCYFTGSQIPWIKQSESGNLHELGCTNSLISFSLVNSYVNPGVSVPISLSSQLFFESAQLMWECCELFGDTVPWIYLGEILFMINV